MSVAARAVGLDLAEWAESVLASAGMGKGGGSASSATQPPARRVEAVRCVPTPLPGGAVDAMAIRLGASSEEVPVWRATIQASLDRADADYGRYRSMTSRSPLLRRLLRLQRLAENAARRQAGAFTRLCDEVGEGVELDRELDRALGLDEGTPVSMTAQVFALAPSTHHASMLAGALERAGRFAKPRSRARRGRKLFATVALALAYVELTGRRPSYGSDPDGGRTGEFAMFCVACDNDLGIDGDGKGFDHAIPDAVRIAGPEIEVALVWRELGIAVRSARLGSASFIETA